MTINCKKALLEKTGEPVKGFGMRFRWHVNYWELIFDAQIDLIRRDIARARADDKLIIYLSCPISGRGGGDHNTNVEIARCVERALLSKWGERFWILDPAQYQMESEEGKSMMQVHADKLGIDLQALHDCFPETAPAPSGGDYMRMWTKILVEDHPVDGENRPYYKPYVIDDPKLNNTAQHFDAFYFVGPKDIQGFFLRGGTTTLSAAIETHFARKFAADPGFRDAYTVDGIAWGTTYKKSTNAAAQIKLRAQWDDARRSYLRFYALRASANFSLGSHDEWNIYRTINERRRCRYGANDNRGIAEQLAGFFDGMQIDTASTEITVSGGYST